MSPSSKLFRLQNGKSTRCMIWDALLFAWTTILCAQIFQYVYNGRPLFCCPNSTRLSAFPMTLHRNPIIFIAEVGHAPAKECKTPGGCPLPCRVERLYFWKFNFVARSIILSLLLNFNWFTNLSLSLEPTLCTFVNNNSFCVHIKMQISLKSLLQFVLMILWAMLWKMMS